MDELDVGAEAADMDLVDLVETSNFEYSWDVGVWGLAVDGFGVIGGGDGGGFGFSRVWATRIG